MRRGAVACALLVAAVLGCDSKSEPWREPTPADVAAALELIPPYLKWQPMPLPDDQNALVPWRRAAAKLVPFTDDGVESAFYDAMSPGNPVDFPEGERRARLEKWLASNEEALALVDEGLALGWCRFDITIGEQLDDSLLQSLRQVARIRRVRAALATADREFEQACNELIKGLRMAKTVCAAEGAPIHFLIGIAFGGIARGGVRELAAEMECPATVLERLIAALAPRGEVGQQFVTALKIDFAYVAADLSANPGRARMDAACGPVVFADGSNFAKIATDTYRAAVRSAVRPWPEREIRLSLELRALVEEHTERSSEAMLTWATGARADAEERIRKLAEDVASRGGGMYAALLTDTLRHMLECQFQDIAEGSATRAVLALRLFEMRKRRLPEELDELVEAGILDSIPVDPFADKPLRYSRERRRVWSVGPDETDDGGGDRPASWTGKDYVLVVPGDGVAGHQDKGNEE